jgi:hypothetical protein
MFTAQLRNDRELHAEIARRVARLRAPRPSRWRRWLRYLSRSLKLHPQRERLRTAAQVHPQPG